jgi:N-acetylglutamate synthase-like GNAT family acetyltransferase
MSQTERVAIRRGRPGDAAAVRDLVAQLGYRPDERSYDETFAQVVRHPEAAVFIAQDGLKVIGYLAMSFRPQIRLAARVASIDELAVAADVHGHGIGTRLLDAAVQHARSMACQRVEVLSGRVRESYQRGFYARRGFGEVDSAVFRLDEAKR